MQCAIRSTPVLKKCASDHLSSFIARSGRLHFQTTSIIIVVKEHSISCIFLLSFYSPSNFYGIQTIKEKKKIPEASQVIMLCYYNDTNTHYS